MPIKSSIREIKRYRSAYLFISPFYILYGIFGAFPLIYALILSFHNYSGGPWEFVGIGNYRDLFDDEVFWITLKNTGIYWLLHVPPITFIAAIMAFVLNSQFVKYRHVFQLIYILPYVTSAVAVGIVFSILFDESLGLINAGLTSLGLPGVPWLSESLSKVTVAIVVNWKWIGYNMLLILAGLQNIPLELYDAATIDGANNFQIFWRITVPLVTPVLLFCAIMSTIGSFNLFTEPFIVTQGGPAFSSYTFGIYLYNIAFQYYRLGYAASLGFVMFILIFIASFIQMKIFTPRY